MNGFKTENYQLVQSNSVQFLRCEMNGHHHHHHHLRRVAGEGRRVVAPPCPRLTARLQRSPIGRMESFRSWSSHLFRGRPGGRHHMRSGGRLNDTFIWSGRATFEVCRQVEPHAQIPRCVDAIGDGTVKSDRSFVALHHFGLGRTIGFQAAVSDTSGGKHPESSHQLTVRSRCLRRIATQTKRHLNQRC